MRRLKMKKIIAMLLSIGIALNSISLEPLVLAKEEGNEQVKEISITPEVPGVIDNSIENTTTKTLLVVTDEQISDTYNAVTCLQYGELYILQYGTEEESDKAFQKFKKLEKEGKIKSVELDQVMEITTNEVQQENLKESLEGRSTYLEMPIKGKEVVVAVLDTGYDKKHIQCDRIIDLGLNYTASEEKEIQDDNGHGTIVSNIILENTNENIKILPIKVLDSNGMGSTLSVYSGIQAAVENGAEIINISMSSKDTFVSPIIKNAIKQAREKGIFVVVSAGNQSQDISNFSPANIEEAVVVSAINSNLTLSTYSNYGNGIDFCSYGSVVASGLNNKRTEATGTSVATAIVSTVIANCKILNPDYNYEDIYKILVNNSYDLGEKGKDNCFGNGALAISTITGLYENYVCTQAEIFQCNWNLLSDEELNEIIQNTTDINLSLFLQQLSKNELEEILKRNTDLNKIKQTITFDKNMKCLSERRYVYYEYLLENNFSIQSSIFGSTTGYFYAMYSQNGIKKTEIGRTKITMKVNNIAAWEEFTEIPIYELSSSDTQVFSVAAEQPETQKDVNGNYFVAYTQLCRENVPAHYVVSNIEDDHVLPDSSDVIYLSTVTSKHSNKVYDCYFVLAVDTNAAGLTWWGEGQAGGDNKDPNNDTVRHTTVTVDFSLGKEKLKINPNGGKYTYQGNTKTKTFVLATKSCGATSSIGTPTRTGYTFEKWKVIHEEGGSGKYSTTSKKYTYCGSGGTSTLKAIWKKNATPTPTPKPTATATPKPTATATPKPTATATPKPTATATPKPTATATPKPTATATPKPAATTTPKPTATVAPKPTVTATPKPTATATPKPTATATPKPTATATPKPTATATPKPTATATPKPTATATPIPVFHIRYEGNEPTEIEKVYMEPSKDISIDSEVRIKEMKKVEEAQFVGWCLAIGQWKEENGHTVLQSVRWLNQNNEFEDEEIIDENKDSIDTSNYTGKIFCDQVSVQELAAYVTYTGEELTLVGKWKINVNYNAGDGVNTTLLNAGQQGIIPDKRFYLLEEIPTLKGNEFAGWQKYDDKTGSKKEWNSGEIIEDGFGKNTILYAGYKFYIQYQKADGTILKNKENLVDSEKNYNENIVIGEDVVFPTNGNHQGYHYPEEQEWQVIEDNSSRYQYANAMHYPEKNYKNIYTNKENVKVNRNVILRAMEQENTYTIQYHANNNIASTKDMHSWEKMKPQTIYYEGNVVLRDISGSILPGYEFSGWNTKADGTGTTFQDKENKEVKEFLNQAGAEINKNGAVIHLYAQWKPKSYTIVFDVNSPIETNNTHRASHTPVIKGTKIMEYVWDSYVVDGKIEELELPDAELKGWHQRFQESLWYTQSKYNTPGNAIKNGTKLGYDILGMPGDKQVYAQWEANTYTVIYCGNGSQDGGRGIVEGKVEEQELVYDLPSTLRENKYVKKDESFRYHDDEKLEENDYRIKHNENADSNYKYYWLGWNETRITEGENEKLIQPDIAGREEICNSKVWNLTDVDKGKVTLYALWNGIPNITTKTNKNHFDRYEGAKITALDMKKIVKADDLEEGKKLAIEISNIAYYENGILKSSIQNPEDDYILDTTLSGELQKEGKYKTYTITFEVEDSYGTKTYMEELPKRTVTYTGRIYYNNKPEIMAYNNEELYDRYIYLQELQDMTKEEFCQELTRQVKIVDKEDDAYQKDKSNDLYLGRISENPIVEIAELEALYETAVHPKDNWNEEEHKNGKNIKHTIKYMDIFGKQKESIKNIHIVDVDQDESLEDNRKKQYVRFISKEYLDTLKEDSLWKSDEEYRRKLEETLNSREKEDEVYTIENGMVKKME